MNPISSIPSGLTQNLGNIGGMGNQASPGGANPAQSGGAQKFLQTLFKTVFDEMKKAMDEHSSSSA